MLEIQDWKRDYWSGDKMLSNWQEEADALDAARAAGDEADAAELEQEEEDAAYAERLAEEEAQDAQEVETQRRQTMIRDTAGTGQFLPSNLLLPNPNLNLTSNSSTPTPVEVDEFTGTINLIDQVTRANAFLTKGNIERRIASASSILFQLLRNMRL
jgi:hypothetical protein